MFVISLHRTLQSHQPPHHLDQITPSPTGAVFWSVLQGCTVQGALMESTSPSGCACSKCLGQNFKCHGSSDSGRTSGLTRRPLGATTRISRNISTTCWRLGSRRLCACFFAQKTKHVRRNELESQDLTFKTNSTMQTRASKFFP